MSGAGIQSISDCKCKNGYVAFEGKCTYAYVFHVHGRAYIQGPKMNKSADLEEFKSSMSKALNVAKSDVLPYRVTSTNKFTVDSAAATMDHSRVMIAEGSSGAETGDEKGIIVSFAIHKLGNSMNTGNRLVDELKEKQVLKNFDTKFSLAGAKMTRVYIWALTAQFWHPAASIEECNPKRKGFEKKNHLGVTDHSHDGEYATDTCKACVQDFQCEPADCYANGKPVKFNFAAVKRGNMICKTQLTCSPANDNSGNFCFRPYTWATKYEATKAAVVQVVPTNRPTLAPTQKWRRAKIQIPITVQDIAPAALNYQARAQLLVEFAKLVNTPTQDVFYVRINPIDRHHDDHTNTHKKQDGYSAAYHQWKGTKIIFGVFTYSQNEAKKVVNTVNQAGFPAEFKKHLSDKAGQVSIDVDTVVVVPEKISSPTVLPTHAPTHASQTPGSKNSCTQGTIMEVRGSARLQSLYNLEEPLDRVMNFMDNQKNGLRKCMAKEAGGKTQWCNMVVLNWDMKKLAIFENQLTAHQHADLGVTTFSKYAYIYTFNFVLAVPGQNMHVGNGVYNKMNIHNRKFLSNVNYCTSNRKKGTVKTLVPIAYHEGTKLSKYDEDMFNEPMLESMNMTSIELTYVARTPTPSPTAPPTFNDEDCKLSVWSGLSACDKTCGKHGVARKWRIILAPSSGSGAVCGSKGFETESTESCVDLPECPKDCIVGIWSDWSTCSVSCGKGDRTRTRKITTPSAGGMACPKSTETTKCVEKACPVDCKLSAWSDSNACTKTCGGGVERRYRRIVTAPMYGGKQCEDISPISQSASTTGPLEEELSCNANPCPTDCVTSKWSAWGSCSKTCGDKPPGTRLFGAKQERTRYIQTPASDDGVPCGSLVQQRLCALHPCGAHVCTTNHGFPLTCTYENGVVYTHHVNDVHDNELFMCYHNYVTEVCTCLCWPKSVLNKSGTEKGIERVSRKAIGADGVEVTKVSDSSDVSMFAH